MASLTKQMASEYVARSIRAVMSGRDRDIAALDYALGAAALARAIARPDIERAMSMLANDIAKLGYQAVVHAALGLAPPNDPVCGVSEEHKLCVRLAQLYTDSEQGGAMSCDVAVSTLSEFIEGARAALTKRGE